MAASGNNLNEKLAHPATGTSPCEGCGLCCDGTLFAKARAFPSEHDRLNALGVSVSEEDSNAYFLLPCRHCADGRCAIYEQRFTKCRSFRCKVLKAHEAGEISYDQAVQRIQTAKALRSAVAVDEPGAVLVSVRKDLRRKLSNSKDKRRLLLNLFALDHYLDLWFRNKNPEVVRVDGASAAFSGAADGLSQDAPVNRR